MKRFALIWAGELVSNVGSGMTAFAVAVHVFQSTASAAWVSGAAIAAYLPAIALSPVGGLLADRYDRRLLMILGDLISAVSLIALVLCLQAGQGSLAIILAAVALSSAASALMEPAYKATVSDLLSERDYERASAMVQLAGASRFLVAPVLAGIVMSASGLSAVLMLDAATFLLTIAATGAVRAGMGRGPGRALEKADIGAFREGADCIKGDRQVATLVVLMTGVCFLVAFLQTLVTPLVLGFAEARTLGLVQTVGASGLLGGSLVLGMRGREGASSHAVLARGLFVAGAGMALLGTTTKPVLLCVFMAVFFTALPFINTSAEVMIRRRIPNALQGRTWGLIGFLTQLGYVAAYAVCGPLADRVFGPLLMTDGALAASVGRLIGVGAGRGIGLMLLIAGTLLVALAACFNMRMRDVEPRRLAA